MGVVGRLDQYASMLAYEFDDYSMSENLVTDNATDFNYSFNNQIIATANDIAPDGRTVLCKHDLTGASSPFLNCRANTTLNAGTYTMSMYLKGTTSYSASFAFVGETTSEIYSNTANITTAWQRFTLTFTLINTQTSSRLQLFFSTQGEGKVVSVLEAQLERGSIATDYTSRPSGTAISRVLPATTNTNITGLGTYYSSGFYENVGFTTFLSANVFAPYDLVYDEFSGTLFGAGQGRYMRQYTDKSVIVYNEIDEVSDFRDIVRTGLILDLDAGMNASFNNTGTTWTDLSGNGRNGTINGSPTFTNGYFNITSDSTYISIPNSGLVPRTNDFTYSCWIYFNSVDSLDTIFENGSWSDSLILRYESTQFIVYAENALIGTFSWTATTGVWVNIVLRRLSNTMSCFINNTSIGTPFAMSTDIDLANPNLWLMRSQHSTGQFTNGRIAVFSIYNRALTATEVSQNYNALKHRFGL